MSVPATKPQAANIAKQLKQKLLSKGYPIQRVYLFGSTTKDSADR